MDKFNELREKHKSLIYHSYEITENGFVFHFSIDDIHFYPSWSFEKALLSEAKDNKLLEYAVFNLGMVELVSYWKCACPKKIYINCGSLDNYQIAWWKKLYIKGLGEFCHRNNIIPGDDFFEIVPVDKNSIIFNASSRLNGVLIPVGGGKDSIVTMELLGKHSQNKCYIINPRQPVIDTALTAGYNEADIIGVRRTIDKELLRLNSEGYLNGHTPFSSIVAFSSWIFAYLSGKKYIALSNESSANEVNVTGTEVNHQYSKSTEFEADFRDYISRYFGGTPEYFSLLRGWSEWQITKKFASLPKYLNIFQSCNVGSKTDSWCGKCAKCLYVYIMLAAFLPDEKLIGIFGSNMLNTSDFEELFNGLVYPDYDKPFECVGTKNEINLALQAAYKLRGNNTPLLLQKYIDSKPITAESLDNFFDENNFIPKEFLQLFN